jgi:beta-xylosidase
MEKEKYRNMTISLKVAAEEKIMLKRLAEKHKVSLSEFMYNLVMCFKNQYDYIGMLSPKEEKLAENLRLEKKKNAKLEVQIENADYRVEMEMNHRIQIQNENHELTYQLKEEKAINADQAVELKAANDTICKLKEIKNKLKRSSTENDLKNLAAGGLGLFAGFSLFRK